MKTGNRSVEGRRNTLAKPDIFGSHYQRQTSVEVSVTLFILATLASYPALLSKCNKLSGTLHSPRL